MRDLLPGEYTQMAGRAGRRGLDALGLVLIAVWDEVPSPVTVREVTTGKSTLLESQFRLTYLMICSLFRVEDLKVEDMMKRSFAEFHAQRAHGASQKVIRKAERALALAKQQPWPGSETSSFDYSHQERKQSDGHIAVNDWEKFDRQQYAALADVTLRADKLSDVVRLALFKSPFLPKLLRAGRVVVVRDATTGHDEIAVVLGEGGNGGGGKEKDKEKEKWMVLSLRRHGPVEGFTWRGRGDDVDSKASIHPDPVPSNLGPGLRVHLGPGKAHGSLSSASASNGSGGPAITETGLQVMGSNKKGDDAFDVFGGGAGKKVGKGKGKGKGKDKKGDDGKGVAVAAAASFFAMPGVESPFDSTNSPSAFTAFSTTTATTALPSTTSASHLPRVGTVGEAGVGYAIWTAAASSIRSITAWEIDVTEEETQLLVWSSPSTSAASIIAAVESRLVRDLLRLDPGDASDASVASPPPPRVELPRDLGNQMELHTQLVELTHLESDKATLSSHLKGDPHYARKIALSTTTVLLKAKIKQVVQASSDANLRQLPEFLSRVRVLERLQYVSDERTVLLKGRVMCELQSGEPLLATELIFRGILTDLEPAECVALLSALVFQEKVDGEPDMVSLPDNLRNAHGKVLSLAYELAEVQLACGVELGGQEEQQQQQQQKKQEKEKQQQEKKQKKRQEEKKKAEEWVTGQLKFQLMPVVYAWAMGKTFAEICELTPVMEGSIVRTILRLDEQCRMVRNAARVMGNVTLFEKLEKASELIKRDVIFAGSLYLQ